MIISNVVFAPLTSFLCVPASCCKRSTTGCGGTVCGCRRASPGSTWRTAAATSTPRPLTFTPRCLAPCSCCSSDSPLRGWDRTCGETISPTAGGGCYSTTVWLSHRRGRDWWESEWRRLLMCFGLNGSRYCCCRFVATPLADVWGIRDRIRLRPEANPLLENYFCQKTRAPSQVGRHVLLG